MICTQTEQRLKVIWADLSKSVPNCKTKSAEQHPPKKTCEKKRQAIVELQTLIDNGEQNEVDLQEFLRNIRKYTDPTELTAEILNDLVDKIVIHAPDKSSGHRKQKIEIYYKAVGIINIANEDCVALDGRLGMQNRKKKTAW